MTACLFVCLLEYEYNPKNHTFRVFINDPPHKEVLHRSSSNRRDGHNSMHDTREGSSQVYLLARRITTALGALRQILFVDVSPPASLLGCSLCLEMLSFSDA